VVLLDDPLSAVDANVGHHLLHNCILNGPFAHRTRILVTHQLDVLPRADLILVMERDDVNEGHIIQQGTYQELLQQEGVFQTLLQEYGSAAAGNSTSIEGEGDGQVKGEGLEKEEVPGAEVPEEDKQKGGKLLLDEERETGEISWMTYLHFVRAIDAWWMVVAVFFTLVWLESSRVLMFLFLGYWSRNRFEDLSQGAYMGIYGGESGETKAFNDAHSYRCCRIHGRVGGKSLGRMYFLLILYQWISLYLMIVAGNRASFRMFKDAWSRVMRSPTSWHDRTPVSHRFQSSSRFPVADIQTGRILSRMSKGEHLAIALT
jgi:ATP-binding cassette subfamily C (CFTR/MRP) protein 1